MAKLKSGTRVYGSLQVDGTLLDSDGDAGSSGQVLSSTATGTNWVDAGGGGSATIRAATFYGSNASQSITTEATVDLDQTLTTTGTGDFTVSASGVVTVVNTGLYVITYSISTDVTSDSTRTGTYAYLRQAGSGEVTASRVYMYTRNLATGEATGSKSLLINVTSGNTTFEVRAGRLTGPETVIAIGTESTFTFYNVS